MAHAKSSHFVMSSLVVARQRLVKIPHCQPSQSYAISNDQLISLSSCQTPAGAQDQIFVTARQLLIWWCRFTTAVDPHQHSHSQVWVPWDSWPLFYGLRFETPPTWRARSPYLYPPTTGWSNYTPRHRVPFLSPSTILRATVEVFKPTSTQATLTANPTAGPCCIALVWTTQKTLHP
jgi:hypothetical protein